MADQTQRGEAYSVDAAVNPTEYKSLWASLALGGHPPTVDFATEIVIHFGAVFSGSCPEIRLDGVNFDLDRLLVTAAVIQLGGNRECTADANSLVPVPAFKQLVPAPGYAVVSIAEPVVRDGRLTITIALWCGNLCGTGGAAAIEKLDNGTWTITDPVGPQWNA
ncbi:MAG: hypothetical protein ABI862_18610 [Ilumatobacteraceae bacterium]